MLVQQQPAHTAQPPPGRRSSTQQPANVEGAATAAAGEAVPFPYAGRRSSILQPTIALGESAHTGRRSSMLGPRAEDTVTAAEAASLPPMPRRTSRVKSGAGCGGPKQQQQQQQQGSFSGSGDCSNDSNRDSCAGMAGSQVDAVASELLLQAGSGEHVRTVSGQRSKVSTGVEGEGERAEDCSAQGGYSSGSTGTRVPGGKSGGLAGVSEAGGEHSAAQQLEVLPEEDGEEEGVREDGGERGAGEDQGEGSEQELEGVSVQQGTASSVAYIHASERADDDGVDSKPKGGKGSRRGRSSMSSSAAATAAAAASRHRDTAAHAKDLVLREKDVGASDIKDVSVQYDQQSSELQEDGGPQQEEHVQHQGLTPLQQLLEVCSQSVSAG